MFMLTMGKILLPNAFLYFLISLVKEMAKPNEQLTPVNGYLTFQPGVKQQKVGIRAVDDITPEDNTPYTVVLYSPKGGARLDTNEFIMLLEGELISGVASELLYNSHFGHNFLSRPENVLNSTVFARAPLVKTYM